eukprot:TRINITY_DN729_c1_g1_i5.p1 TRINITY_DN729_c1_g1~~TRINITY_DN729_c1_g1_i5.p1  ORF type:complete len:989 (-),score=157.06 TRINITY_DN729_c1_g1_i5:1559-4525(-)
MNSSHAVAPLSRLLWKEYRTQRSLWLVMLALGAVPQILMRFSIGEPAPRAALVWVLVGVLPFLFVIGSTAILFAGEREERTVDWLMNLAAPPQWTLLAKWMFVLLATVSLATTLAISALLLVWSGPFAVDSAQGAYQRSADDGVVFRMMFVFVGIFLWGALGSLVSRRVVTAVAAAGIWWVVTFLVPCIWFPGLLGFKPNLPGYSLVQERVAVLSFVAMAIANLGLGWLWCQGRYLDATVLDEVNLRVAETLSRWRGRTATKMRLPKGVEADSPWRREWQRLIWQERCRDRNHRNLLYSGYAICFVLGIMGYRYLNDFIPTVILLIVVLPMTMGILGFRYDGEGHPLRFLSNRGVEARILWLAKHAVWLPRAIWIPLSLCLVAATLQAIQPYQSFQAPGNNLLRQAGVLSEYPGGTLAFVLLTYGCGHLAAILFRRTILAVVVGFTASLLSTLWLMLAILLEVPLWWSMGGLIAWMYAVTWLSIPSWLIEHSLPGRIGRFAAYTVPVILLITVWGAWRAYEIPGFHPNLLSSKQSFERINVANVRKEQIGLVAVAKPPQDYELGSRLGSLTSGFSTEQDFVRQSHSGIDPGRILTPVEAFWHHNGQRLKELLEITSDAQTPSASRWSAFARANAAIEHQQLVLQEAGRLRTREGQLDDGLTYYLASLRLASLWSTDRGFLSYLGARQQQLLTLDGIVQWASHPDQTSEKLRSARRRLQAEFELFPSIEQALVVEHRADLLALEDTIESGARWSTGTSSAWQLFIIDYFRFLPWEKVRANRWLEQELLDRDQVAKNVSELLRIPGVDVGRRLDHIELRHLLEELRDRSTESSWRLTTPLVVTGANKKHMVASMMIDAEVAIRESLLALSLLAWKHDHQQWPTTLTEALDGLPSVTAIDPWSGEYFLYSGEVLNRDQGDTPVFVLSSVGLNKLREVQLDGSPLPTTELRTWSGVRVVHDDRLRLRMDGGKLSFQLPHHVQAAHDGSRGSN